MTYGFIVRIPATNAAFGELYITDSGQYANVWLFNKLVGSNLVSEATGFFATSDGTGVNYTLKLAPQFPGDPGSEWGTVFQFCPKPTQAKRQTYDAKLGSYGAMKVELTIINSDVSYRSARGLAARQATSRYA